MQESCHNTYVITHRDAESSEGITFIHDDPCFLIERLKRVKSEKNIWICGGASVVRQLLDADLIDLFHHSCDSWKRYQAFSF